MTPQRSYLRVALPPSLRFCAALLTWLLAFCLSSPLVTAQHTPEEVESFAGAGTYLDLTDDPAGTMRNGLTMIWSNFTALAWDFPDGSDGAEFVGGTSADDKEADGGTPTIQLDLSGLTASTNYTVFLAARARPPGNDEGGDISWGTSAGSLTTFNYDTANLPAGSVEVDREGPTDSFLALLNVGSLSSNASGLLTIFVGEGLPWQDPPIRNRTQFDGIFLRESFVAGDVDDDGFVTATDFNIIKMNFGNTVTSRGEGDLTLDGIVDFADFRQWKENASGTLADSLAVPEPASIASLILGTTFLWLVRARSPRRLEPFDS